jgi:chromosome segregation ATPase
MVMYNKNKIIEQGGKAARGAGTFPQHLFEQFQASNETTKQYLESPQFTNANKKINELKKLDLMYPPEQLENFIKKIGVADKKIASLKRDIKRFNKSESPDIKSINRFKKEIKGHESDKERFNKSIESHNSEKERIAKDIESMEKEIIDNAPSGAKITGWRVQRI